LIYLLGGKMFGVNGALIAATCYALSSISIEYSRFSWNPNPAPFFMILLIYSLYLAWQKKFWAWLGVFFSLGCLVQLHYVNLLAVAGSGLIWMFFSWKNRRQLVKADWLRLVRFTVLGVALVIVMLSPLVLFDLRHQGLNLSSLKNIFGQEKTFAVTSVPEEKNSFFQVLAETHGRSQLIIGDLGFTPNDHDVFKNVLVMVTLGYLIFILLSQRPATAKFKPAAVILLTLNLVAIGGMAFYQHSVFRL